MVEPVSFLVDIAIGVDNVWDYMVWTAFCARVQACMRSLFFYLVKHGVDQELLDDVFAQIKKLFAHERRRKCFMIRITVGYTAFEGSRKSSCIHRYRSIFPIPSK
jgi:isopenicillin N synthase-like dioxygenase